MRKVDVEEVRTIKECPKGSFVKVLRKDGTPQGTVYIRGDYVREEKKYELQAFEDINKFRYIKGDQKVLTGFTY